MEKIHQLRSIEDLSDLSEAKTLQKIEDLEIGKSIEFEFEKTEFKIFNTGLHFVLDTFEEGVLVPIDHKQKITFRSAFDLSAWLYNYKDGYNDHNDFDQALDLAS